MTTALRHDHPGWDGHLFLLHESESERVDALTEWVTRGLESGERVIYAELPAQPDVSLRAALEEQRVDVDTARTEGRLHLVSPAEMYAPEGPERLVDQAIAEGFPAVRFSAEATATLAVLTPDDLLASERRTEWLCHTRPVSGLCQYPRAVTTGSRLRRTVALHRDGVRQSWFSSRDTGDGLELHGAIDRANVDVFTAVLAGMCDTKSSVVVVDLNAVTFIDVAGCRALIAATERFRSRGGRVLVVAPSLPIEQILRYLGVDEAARMVIIGGEA
jgi:anti-anti-sigma factor